MLRISYDGREWLAMDAHGDQMVLASEESGMLPELPDSVAASKLLLPAEQLLCRAFRLPLQQTRLIDREILAQELEEHSAEKPEAWWLAWQAGRTAEGVAGLVFGMPETMRVQLQAHEAWRQVRYVGIDVCERLQSQLSGYASAVAGDGGVAVFDTDATGVCFGVWSPGEDGSDGFWLGMRRLNCAAAEAAQLDEALKENLLRSLLTMGWDRESDLALGRLSAELCDALALSSWQGEVVERENLPSRNEANLAIEQETGLNFRHGDWRATSSLGDFKPWRRTVALMLLLALAWAGGMMWRNHQLAGRLAASQQRIIAAFHKGLPHERVIIDPLAQLRKAAGGGGDSVKGHDAAICLQRIDEISKVRGRIKWTIKTLSFRDGVMSMSGVARDLQTLNRIRAALQKQSGRPVKLQDTDLSGDRVTFRLAWS